MRSRQRSSATPQSNVGAAQQNTSRQPQGRTVLRRTDLAQGAVQSLHYYLYDAVLEERKHASLLAKIETRLTDLELQGRIGRLGPMRSAHDSIRTAVRQGAKTLVVVGTDHALAETIQALGDEPLTLAFIPTDPRSDAAALLHLPIGEAACEVLAARRVQFFDMARANTTSFFLSATVTGKQIRVQGDGCWNIAPTRDDVTLRIVNAGPGAIATDGLLELVTETTSRHWWGGGATPRASVIPFKRAHIVASSDGELCIDGGIRVKLPVDVTVLPQQFSMIVGPEA